MSECWVDQDFVYPEPPGEDLTDDLRARLEIAEATNHVLTELIYELLGEPNE